MLNYALLVAVYFSYLSFDLLRIRLEAWACYTLIVVKCTLGFEIHCINYNVYPSTSVHLAIGTNSFLEFNLYIIQPFKVQPSQIWQDHRPRNYNQTVRVVFTLPSLIGSYINYYFYGFRNCIKCNL